ncbi:MAG: riboflavin biosynthesis protein RibD, partial [Gemmatimonadetes bacterium]|nr:riboflavin biosynthesis protein RibD [Gemmatimonadota bacterium]
PCAVSLVDAGVARVVYWAPDPGEEEGGGGDWLRNRGVQVDGPFGSDDEWRAENPFFYHRRPSRPYVALKLAVSVDGGLAAAGGRREWLTGPEAREEVHRLRAGFDAILVGAGTWRADDPRLTVRGVVSPPEPPLRVFLNARGDMAPEAAAFREEGPILLAVGEGAVDRVRQRLGTRAEVLPVPPGLGGLDLLALLDALDHRGVRTLLCEGGGRLATGLVRADVLDRIYLFHAPRLLGAGRIPAFPDLPPWQVPREESEDAGAAELEGRRWRRILPPETFGEDVLITLDRSR